MSEKEQISRASNDDLNNILGEKINVLDHGFIRLIDYMGDDASIVQAARVSYGKGTKKLSQDRGLIRYLMRHRHTTPFEMCEIKLHVKLPIFIARQWIRHRTANVNEYSARYSVLDKEFYLPDYIAEQSTINNQGRGRLISDDLKQDYKTRIKNHSDNSYDIYQYLLNEEDDKSNQNTDRPGLARELSRMVLPTNYYTQWYWKVDLHNLLHFISLRADSHAQYEFRVYAEIIAELVQKWVPLTYEAFEDYRMGGLYLSKQERNLLQKLIDGEKIDQNASGLSNREWLEFCDKFQI